MDNEIKYTVNVPPCFEKRYAIGDIHGCINTFKALLDRIELKKSDQLFLLGDYIDRGPSSIGVIDMIIELQNNGYQVFPLRGNHEEEFLLINEFSAQTFISKQYDNQSFDGFFDTSLKLKNKYLNFFESMPYYIELEDIILVHAGFDFSRNKPFEDTDSMLYIRDWEYDSKLAKNKSILHGHSPLTLSEIQKKIELRSHILPLDNGCVFPQFKGLGNLLGLELNHFSLLIQDNID